MRRRERRSKAINFGDALDYRTAMRADSRSVERWILRARARVIFLPFVDCVCVCVSNMNSGSLAQIALPGFSVAPAQLWWFLSWGKNERKRNFAIVNELPNHSQYIPAECTIGLLFWNFLIFWSSSPQPFLATVRHRIPNLEINNSFGRN